MKLLRQGILIAIEGVDGSGKSTLARNLYLKFISQNIPTLLTKEPGATSLGKRLRSLLHKKPVALCPKTEYLLFAADRAQHSTEVVMPALQKNKIVISDRMGDSSIIYQGYAQGLDIKMIEIINNWTMNGKFPDLVFYVRLSAAQAIKRIKLRNKKLTSFEKEGKPFTQTLVDGFDWLFKNRSNVICLDGRNSPEIITEQAFNNFSAWINKYHE
ncbi:dTMP kinase [Candidatus Dependentiae bacterium]|nr:MAG: dTMP kinase [Candidatus Dependentiae bacterium]